MAFSAGPRPAPAMDKEERSVQAQAEMESADAVDPLRPRQLPWHRILGSGGLILAALFFALALTAYLVDQAVHRHGVLTWYDLNVYNDAGLITRQLPSILYTWALKIGVQFTYTPFAALVFAGGSLLPFWTLRWIMTITSLTAIPLTAWFTLGAMERRITRRVAATLAVSALGLWIEPVVKALYLGQIEPLLMVLVVWDLTRPDSRRWKGIGIGIAAGIKLVPLLFVPYLLLAGKVRQAAIAASTFIALIVLGFIALPAPSASYWLTGYFMRPGRTGSVHSLVNQSLLGTLARLYGTVAPAQPVWLPVAIVVAGGGLVGGAMLSRTGRHVQGWTLVGVTSVLVSPISWDHHWVWLVPVLAMLAGLAIKARPLARAAYIAAIVLIAAGTAAWPWQFSGPRAYVPRRGMLGWFVKPPLVTEISVVHGWQLLTWNLWVAVGVVIYLGLLVEAAVAWRTRRRPRRQLTEVLVQSPIDALLARADYVLRGGPLAASGQHSQNAQVGPHAAANSQVGSNGSAGSYDTAMSHDTAASYDPADGDGRIGNGDASTDAGRPAAGAPRPTR
jgi:alpha-1,2-mannosyltransferase